MSNKEKLTERWTQGRISEAMLRVYVGKGIITKAEFEEICGKKYLTISSRSNEWLLRK